MPDTGNRISKYQSLIRRIAQRADFIQIIGFSCLITIGLLFIYGTGQQVGYHATGFWIKQLQWVFVGLCCWLLLALVDYKVMMKLSWVFYFICIIMLIMVFFYGIKVYGARRWLAFGPMRIQPSEFAKIGVLLLLSRVMTFKWFNINRPTHLMLAGIVIGIPFVLILKEPALGSAMILVPISAGILFVSNFKWKYIIIGATTVLTLGTAEILNEYYQVKPILKQYQRERIEVFLHPEKDIKNRGWNQLQAKLAVGSGGMAGKGFMQGTQNTLGFLPQTVSNTDFIFSVIAEETGFLGVSMLVACYALLIISALRAAIVARDQFGRYIAAGTAGMIFMHSFVNMGMSIGIMPITGVPLPLVSYGGSFMMSSMIYLGLVQSIYARRQINGSSSRQ